MLSVARCVRNLCVFPLSHMDSRTSWRSVSTSGKEPEKVGTKHTCAVGEDAFVLGGVVLCCWCGGSTGPSSVLQAAPEALLLPSGSGSSSAEAGSGFTTVEVAHTLVNGASRVKVRPVCMCLWGVADAFSQLKQVCGGERWEKSH